MHASKETLHCHQQGHGGPNPKATNFMAWGAHRPRNAVQFLCCSVSPPPVAVGAPPTASFKSYMIPIEAFRRSSCFMRIWGRVQALTRRLGDTCPGGRAWCWLGSQRTLKRRPNAGTESGHRHSQRQHKQNHLKRDHTSIVHHSHIAATKL